MSSNRARRDRKRAKKEEVRGNAVHFSGLIENRRCILPVFVAHPDANRGEVGIDTSRLISVQAVIDTGATASCVSQELANRLGLVSHGKTKVGVVGGTTELDQAAILVCFVMPDGRHIHKTIPVAIGSIGYPMLFGMRELTPGVLTVDCMMGTWDWKVPNRAMGRPPQLHPPTAPAKY